MDTPPSPPALPPQLGAAVFGLAAWAVTSSYRSSSLSAAAPNLLSLNQHISKTGDQADAYTAYHTGGKKGLAQAMVDQYYSLATDLYISGWGESFHFATRWVGESLKGACVWVGGGICWTWPRRTLRPVRPAHRCSHPAPTPRLD